MSNSSAPTTAAPTTKTAGAPAATRAATRRHGFDATRKADVEQVKARLQLSRNDEYRAKSLQAENKNFVSIAEMDKVRFERMALEAQLLLAEKMVDQAVASVKQAEAQLKLS